MKGKREEIIKKKKAVKGSNWRDSGLRRVIFLEMVEA